jgi:hypothetical protein
MLAEKEEPDSKNQGRTKLQLAAGIANHRTQNQEKLIGFGGELCAIRRKLRIIAGIEQLQKESRLLCFFPGNPKPMGEVFLTERLIRLDIIGSDRCGTPYQLSDILLIAQRPRESPAQRTHR